MSEARVLLAFLAVVSISLLYVSIGVKSALAPLCAATTTALWFTLFGTLGLLWAGGLAFYILAALAAVWLVCKQFAVFSLPKAGKTPNALRVKLGAQLSFGFWFFIVACLVCIALLWARQPMFVTWDEFSFWGTAGKLSKLYNQMYTTAPVGWAWAGSQTPVLIVLNYFVQYLGQGFAEWQTYVATDIYLLAGMAAVLGVFEKRRWPAAVGAALAMLLIPFVFVHNRNVLSFSPAYLDSLGDVPLGVAFGGAIASWYVGKEGNKKFAGMLPVCLSLAALALVKDMTGLVLALVVALVVCVDCWCTQRQDGKMFRKNAKGALARFGVLVASTLLPYIWWKFVYLSGAAGVNALADSGGKLGVGLLEYPFMFIRDLFSPNKSEFFTSVTGGMARNFVSLRGTLFGSGAMIMAGVAAMLVLACIFAKSREHRRKCIAYGVVSAAGVLLYTLLITMTYLYMMRIEQAEELISYERYMLPVYVGCFMGAVVLLGQSIGVAAAGKKRVALGVNSTLRIPAEGGDTSKNTAPLGTSSTAGKKRIALGTGVFLLLGAFMLVRVGQVAPIGSTIAGVHWQDFNYRRQYAQYVQNLRAKLDENGKTFIVLSEDDGFNWFLYCYEMLPWQVDYSYGGGPLLEKTLQTDGTTLEHEVTAQELAQHLIDTGCTTLYIDNADENFVNLYAQLFSDEMSGYLQDGLRLYSVQQSGGSVVLTPVQGAANDK